MSDQHLGLDFSKVKTGTVVTESDHFREQQCKTRRDVRRIGILVDKRFYNTVGGGCQCWPVIHWEGSAMESITHPMNAVPFRKGVGVPTMVCRELLSASES